MVDLKKIKEYTWILLVIAAVFAIISLCLPLSFNTFKNRYYWMAGFLFDLDTSEILANPSDIALIGGIVETLIMIICILILIGSAISIKFDKLSEKKIQLLVLISSILMLIISIAYFAVGAVSYDDWNAVYVMQFGFIAPIIAFIIALPCIILIKDA